MSVIDSPAGIRLYQFAASIERISLEDKGIRFKGRAIFNDFKKAWTYKGDRTSVVQQARADKEAGKAERLGDIKSEKYRELWLDFLSR